MKMNMKNNKTMLALVVVAALAMVSVAGVALATNEDSDAASASTLYLNSGDPVFANQTYTGDVYVYTALYEADGTTLISSNVADVTVSINSTATFTGHVYFGTAKLNSSGQVTTNAVYNDVSLNGVSDVTVQVTGDISGYTVSTTTITGETTGSVALNKGALTIGSVFSFTSFSGVVTANGVTLDSDYTAGTTVSLGTVGSKTTTYLTGPVVGVISDLYKVDSSSVLTLAADSLPTLSVSGTFTINKTVGDIFYVEYAEFIIADGAKATLFNDSAAYASSQLENNGALLVDGTLMVSDLSGFSVDAIDNNGILYVGGTIQYTTLVGLTTGAPIDDGYINASYYYASATTLTNIHYYTTFTNAIANSNNVTVYGVNFITSDVTIKNNVTLAEDAIVIVGVPNTQIDFGTIFSTLLTADELGMVKDAMSLFGLTTDSLKPAYATITVAADGNLNTADGDIYVINGKISVDIDATGDYANVTSSVSMKEGTNTIYTNLETALSLAKSGDTIVLSWYGYIFSNSTIPADVTVDGSQYGGFDIFVYCGTTLNINGTLKCDSLYILPNVDATATRNGQTASISLDAATVNVNSGSSVYLKFNLYLLGTLNVASGFDNLSTGSTDEFTVIGDIYVFNFKDSGSFDENVSIPSTSYYYYVAFDYTADINGSQLNVAGKLNLGDSAFVSLTSDNKVAVNVTGTLKSAAITNDVVSTVTVSGSYISAGTESITNLAVSGNGSVTEVSGGLLSVDYLTSGTAATSFSGVQNNVTIKIKGDVGYALIYGITSTGAISFDSDVKSTEFYMSNSGTSVLYAVEYSSSLAKGVYLYPSVTGYDFINWMVEEGHSVSKTDITSQKIGTYDELYTYFELTEYTVKLDYVQNGTWVINGISYGNGGNVTLAYSSSGYTAELKAANGYHLNNVSILLDNKVLPNGHTSTLADGQVFTISGSVDQDSQPESTDIVEILLIVITIVVVIMAIVIALRLMRS